MRNSKHFITLFFVALFFFFKVAGLHALTHHEDDSEVQHCEVCHIATAVNFTPLLPHESSEVPEAVYFFTAQKINDQALSVSLSNRHLSGALFTRPPPLLS